MSACGQGAPASLPHTREAAEIGGNAIPDPPIVDTRLACGTRMRANARAGLNKRRVAWAADAKAPAHLAWRHFQPPVLPPPAGAAASTAFDAVPSAEPQRHAKSRMPRHSAPLAGGRAGGAATSIRRGPAPSRPLLLPPSLLPHSASTLARACGGGMALDAPPFPLLPSAPHKSAPRRPACMGGEG